MVDQTHIQDKPPAVGAALVTPLERPVKFATPLQEVEVVVIEQCCELGLLDKCLKIVIVWENLCNKLGLEMNRKRRLTIQTANGRKEEMQGCIKEAVNARGFSVFFLN